MQPTRPPLATRARASARFSSLTTATASTSMSDTSSYWASSQPNRHKYRSYPSPAGNDGGFGSPGTDMTSPGTMSEHKFSNGDEKGFPGLGLVAGDQADALVAEEGGGKSSPDGGETAGLDKLLEDEIDRLSFVSSASPRPTSIDSAVPSLTSASYSSDDPSSSASPSRNLHHSRSPSRAFQTAAIPFGGNQGKNSSRHPRPTSHGRHSQYSELSALTDEEDGVIHYVSRQTAAEGLSTIKEERKQSLSILEGHGRVPSSGTVSISGSRHASGEQDRSILEWRGKPSTQRSGTLLASPANLNRVNSSTSDRSSTPTKPLNIRASPGLRDRISIFEGQSAVPISLFPRPSSRGSTNQINDPLTTPRSGYFAKRDFEEGYPDVAAPKTDVTDLFSPGHTVSRNGSTRSGMTQTSVEVAGHHRMPAEGAGSPWMDDRSPEVSTTGFAAPMRSDLTPRKRSGAGRTAVSVSSATEIGTPTHVGTDDRAEMSSFAKRTSLTRTPTRARNLVGQYALNSTDRRTNGFEMSAEPSVTVSERSATPTETRVTSFDQIPSRATSGSPSAQSMSHPDTVDHANTDEPPLARYPLNYLNSKPLPSPRGPANSIPVYATPPRTANGSRNHMYDPRSSMYASGSPPYSPSARSRNVTPTRPTLLSNSYGPSASGSIVIPESPGGAMGSMPGATGRKGISKSPLKDIIGVLTNVTGKVKQAGRRRAGTMDRPYGDLLGVNRGPASTHAVANFTASEPSRTQEREVNAVFGRTMTCRVPASEISHSGKMDESDSRNLNLVSLSINTSGLGMATNASKPLQTQPVIRSSAALYLQSTPCSSLSPWGGWRCARASMTSSTMIFDGSDERHDLDLSHCAEVRSLRREEAQRKGLPPISNAESTQERNWYEDSDRVEILELTFVDGTRVYFGVEGISGRLGWVTALWDAILASRNGGPTSCPPRSPTMSSLIASQRNISPSVLAKPAVSRITASAVHTRPASDDLSLAQPGPFKSMDETAFTAMHRADTADTDFAEGADELSSNVRAMFSIGSNGSPLRTSGNQAWMLAPARTDSQEDAADEWVPAERQLSVFGAVDRQGPEAAPSPWQGIRGPIDVCQDSQDSPIDEDDLNPSRSASQRRPRSPTVVGIILKPHPEALTDSVDEGVKLDPAVALPSRPLPQPLTTAQLLPWKRAPRNLRMPALLEGSSVQPDHIFPQAFPSPHHFDADVYGDSPIPSVAIPVDVSDAASPLSQNDASSEITTIPTVWTGPSASHNRPGLASGADQPAPELGGTSQPSREFVHGTISENLHDRLAIFQSDIAQRIGSIQANMGTSVGQEASTEGIRNIAEALDRIGGDVALLRNTMSLNAAAPLRGSEGSDPHLNQISEKLDAITALLKSQLGGSTTDLVEKAVVGNEPGPQQQSGSRLPAGSVSTLTVKPTASPGVPSVDENPEPVPSKSDRDPEIAKHLSEVLVTVNALQAARSTQDQQTDDMARYLGQLNGWLEKFVLNGTSEIHTVVGKVDRLAKILAPEPPPRDPAAEDGTPTPPPPPSLPDLVREVHDMSTRQQQRAEGEGVIAQRVDALIAMLGEDRQRAAQQQSTFDNILGVLDQQRKEHEVLLRALATDLTGEIRGEKVKFIEAMRDATSVNVNLHVEDFKKMLNQEVTKNMHELAAMREQKKALEMVISDLFAIKAKHTDSPAMAHVTTSTAPAQASPPATPARVPPRSPAPSNLGPRALPKAPGH